MDILDSDFRKLFEAAPGLFIALLPNFTVIAASDAYLEAIAIPTAEIIGKNFFEVFAKNPDKTNIMRASIERVLSTGQADTTTPEKYQITNSDSLNANIKYLSSTNTPVVDVNGQIIYIISRLEDMTEQMLQEGERKTIQQERDLFFTYSFDLLAIVGSDGYFKRINPAFERSMGYTEAELYSRPLTEFLHPDDVTKTKKGIKTLTSGIPTIASINRYRCKDGDYKWFSWNTTPIGSMFYTVGRDITSQVKTEERIKQLHIELEQKNEDLERKVQERLAELQKSEAQVQQLQKMDAIGRLAGGIAHDFNNMLGSISIYSDLVSEDCETPSLIREHVKELRKVTDRAAALTRQLLVFSRKQIIQLQTINLNPIIQQLENMLVRLIGDNIRIVTNLSQDLRTVNVDPSQMEQVILNLAVNAKDSMLMGGTITIDTSNVYLDENFTNTHLSVEPGHYVLLSISDEGMGMDSETMSKIFEPFFTTKPVGKGTGLGLTTTYGIIKQCKGTIWVYSEIDKGSVFKIYLPVADNNSEFIEPTPIKLAESSGHQTILLVEDDEMLREGFSMLLKRKGYQLLVATNGEEALEICSNHSGPIHLLLTDMVMPGLNGLEVSKKALEIRANLRVLYMSGYTSDALENSGVNDLSQLAFIQKPFSTHDLIAKVQEVLA